MRALAAVWLVLSFALVPASAPSQDAVALSTREQKLVARAVPALHALADAYAAQKQHLRAFELRKTIWLDYADNDEKARDKCGFVKVGTQWRKDAARLVLDKDMKGDPRAVKKVEQD